MHASRKRLLAFVFALAMLIGAFFVATMRQREFSAAIGTQTGVTVVSKTQGTARFSFANFEECAARVELRVQIQGAEGEWSDGRVQPGGELFVPRRRAVTFDIPLPENQRPWRVVVKAHSQPTLLERLRAKGRGQGIPPLLGAWASATVSSNHAP